MHINRNDRTVLGIAILIAGVFVISSAHWGVPLIGDSNRWAAVVILVLGLAAGALTAPGAESRSYLLAGLVLVAFLCAVLALATASTATLALLVAAILALIASSTWRHLHARADVTDTAPNHLGERTS